MGCLFPGQTLLMLPRADVKNHCAGPCRGGGGHSAQDGAVPGSGCGHRASARRSRSPSRNQAPLGRAHRPPQLRRQRCFLREPAVPVLGSETGCSYSPDKLQQRINGFFSDPQAQRRVGYSNCICIDLYLDSVWGFAGFLKETFLTRSKIT